MNIWAIVNQKGGVGKTTTTAMLAAELAARGNRVLCLDVDPHASLAHYLRIDPDAERMGLADLFSKECEQLSQIIHQTEWAGVSLATGGSRLATLDRHGRQGLGRVLGAALKQVSDQYDWVLIDCPPTLGVLTINALAACDLLLIPTQTEFLALKGLDSMLRTRDMVQKARGHELKCRIIPTLFDGRTRACKDALAEMQNKYPDFVCPQAIPTDTKVREASAAGIPLLIHAPDARATLAYHALVDGLLGVATTSQGDINREAESQAPIQHESVLQAAQAELAQATREAAL
ncbi:MAG: ParA family protein [Salinisphaeraceae bacterium]|nr:ParA family protein [Salinisphaeraceae bacterium]